MKTSLTSEEVQRFEQDGLLVIDDFLSPSQVQKALHDLSNHTLSRFQIDANNLEETGYNLTQLSSTNGSGGVLDLFYDEWKMKLVSDQRLFHMTTQLWALYNDSAGPDSEPFLRHPYGSFNIERGYAYIDRIGYRIPTHLAERLGKQQPHRASSKTFPIQRSLTPHLDCCPQSLFEEEDKFRPIQCFISLTDNLESNTGGFEAVKGFHKEFAEWTRTRTPSTIVERGPNNEKRKISVQPPCIGNYTHIRPKEDSAVMKRVRHVPVRAGSLVFWDFRLPHANAYRHNGDLPRVVIYCSFLPDIPLNRSYVKCQLENWKRGRQPSDQWINHNTETNGEIGSTLETKKGIFEKISKELSDFEQKLFGLSDW